MTLNLHRNARTTPAIRQELRDSTKSERELARHAPPCASGVGVTGRRMPRTVRTGFTPP